MSGMAARSGARGACVRLLFAAASAVLLAPFECSWGLPQYSQVLVWGQGQWPALGSVYKNLAEVFVSRDRLATLVGDSRLWVRSVGPRPRLDLQHYSPLIIPLVKVSNMRLF